MKLKLILYAFLSILFFYNANAAHIVGGEAKYKCIESNSTTKKTKFLVTFIIYRDGLSGGAPFDNNPSFGIYKKAPIQANWQVVGSQNAVPKDVTTLPYAEPCVTTQNEIEVQKATYEFEVELNWTDDVYQIVYQRCCRNPTINNIFNPKDAGAAYIIEIHPEAVKNCNNSAVFKKFPPILICAGRALDFEHSVSDVESDSVVYEFCAPLDAGGQAGGSDPGFPTDCDGLAPEPLKCLPPFDEVSFFSPFSGSNPIAGNPQIKINPSTGKITGVPRVVGQFVVGVCAKEFRKGKLLSIIRRDFQFNVSECNGPFETIAYEICEKDSIIVNGVIYNTNGIYTQQLTSQGGCDSTLTIEVNLKNTIQKNVELEKCANKSINYNGTIYAVAGTYQQTIQASTGCDTILTLKIKDVPIKETKLNFKLCDGESLKVNNQTYTTSGAYQQLLSTSKGCDSLLMINIEGFPKKATDLSYKLCEGETVTVNDVKYDKSGSFQQILKTTNGCDSTLSIKINILSKKITKLSYKICDDEVVTINNVEYKTTGNFEQLLKSFDGCDSLLSISILKSLKSEKVLDYKICDDEAVELNGKLYDVTGTYQQLLKTTNGCDSLLVVNVVKNFSKETVFNYSLCDADKFVVNNQEYKNAGQFIQSLLTVGGCDSLIVINITQCEKLLFYDFEACNASNPENTMMYAEFLPTYKDSIECGEISATNIYRNYPQGNKHSCTPGHKGGLAMCVSSSSNCNFQNQTVNPITFEITIEPKENSIVKFNQVSFFQKAPKNYEWIGGSTGLNNYPTRYGIKITKDGTEVFSSLDKPTSLDWSEEKFQFENLTPFEVTKKAVFKIELLPYCLVGNSSIATAWDIDDVNVFISCKKSNNRTISGKIIGFDGSFDNLLIERREGNILSTTSIDQSGSFTFKNNKLSSDYEFSVKLKNENADLVKNVSSIDMVIIQSHILGLNAFTKNTSYIAADVNNDKKITVTDIVHLRKAILGIDLKFQKNTSWKFVDKLQIEKSVNPFEIKSKVKLKPSAVNVENLDFMAVKIGDINGG